MALHSHGLRRGDGRGRAPRLASASARPSDVKAKLEALSMEVRSGASAELRAVLAADMGKWGRLVKEKNIRIAQ